MDDPTRRRVSWADITIVLATTALAFATVGWADRAYFLFEGPTLTQPPRTVTRPPWIWALYNPYRRFQHDFFWISAILSLGIAALLASDRRTWTRRSLSRTGTIVVAVTLLIGGLTSVHYLLFGSGFGGGPGPSYALRNFLTARIPGAILGAWVVTWLGRRRRRRKADGRDQLGQLVGWIWMVNVGLLIAYGLLFG